MTKQVEAKEPVVTVAVRLTNDAHKAVNLAAARANLSVSAWLANIAMAASASANAMAMIEELGKWGGNTEELRLDTAQKALELLHRPLDLSGAQHEEVREVLELIKKMLMKPSVEPEVRGAA